MAKSSIVVKRRENARNATAAWLSGRGLRNSRRRIELMRSLRATCDEELAGAIAAKLRADGFASIEFLLNLEPALLRGVRGVCVSGCSYKARAGAQEVSGDDDGKNLARREKRVSIAVPISEDSAVAVLGIAGAMAVRRYLCRCTSIEPCGLRLLDSSTVPQKPSLCGQVRHADYKRANEVVVVAVCTDLSETVGTLFARGSHKRPLADLSTPLAAIVPASKCVAFDARVSHSAAPSESFKFQPGRWFLSFYSECLPQKRIEDALSSYFSPSAAARFRAAREISSDRGRSCIENERSLFRGADIN